MWTMFEQIAPYALAYTMPLLVTALGGLYSERSGVVNIGLEGLMVAGSFASALVVSLLTHSHHETALWLGLAAGAAAGMLVSLLHAFASITLNANQIISGTAINMIAGSVTVFIARNITGSGNIGVEGFSRFPVPVLADVPIIGKLFFTNTYATTWLVIMILIITYFVLQKTVYGLRLRACGEHPHAAAAAGISVRRIRYMAVMLSGALSGLGGAIMVLTYSGEFNGSVFGLGFLALAALIFGQWKPLGVLGATLVFGFASTIANVSQVTPIFQDIPNVVLKTFPYVLTLAVLVIFSKHSQAPRANGEPFEQGKR